MAKNTRLTNLAVNTEADAFAALMDGGFIDIYDGLQPDSADAPLGKQVRGVSLGLGRPAFMPALDGILSANPITPGVATASINPATWARVYRADHKTFVMDVSVGTRDANIILRTTNIPEGVKVECSSFQHLIPKSVPGS
jgi:hypothetical protein